jgi:hypothetical protein
MQQLQQLVTQQQQTIHDLQQANREQQQTIARLADRLCERRS